MKLVTEAWKRLVKFVREDELTETQARIAFYEKVVSDNSHELASTWRPLAPMARYWAEVAIHDAEMRLHELRRRDAAEAREAEIRRRTKKYQGVAA